MSVTTHLMRPGDADLRLIPGTPYRITSQILTLIEGVGCHLVITPVPIDPNLMADGDILAKAADGGHTLRVTGRPERTSITATGISTWMDTTMETGLAKTAGTPIQWLTDLLPNGLNVGTVSGGSNVSHEFYARGQTYRGALDVIAEKGGFEYRVNPDFTVDIGAIGALFQTPPNVVITGKSEGPDGTLIGLLGSIPGPTVDASNPATKVIAVGQGEGESVVVGEDTQTIPLLTWDGAAAVFVQTVSAPTQTEAGAATVAAAVIGNFPAAKKSITVKTDQKKKKPTSSPANDVPYTRSGPGYSIRPSPTPAGQPGTNLGTGGGPRLDWTGGGIGGGIKSAANLVARLALGRTGNRTSLGDPSAESQFVGRILHVGDEVYVYDLEAGIVDLAQQIFYRGEFINPALLRVLSLSDPNEAGKGYYIRPNGASIAGTDYIDITPYVAPEQPGATLEVGDWTPASYGRANRADPALEDRVGSTPGRVAWSPVITQGSAVAGTVNWAWYIKHADGTFSAHVTWTASAGGTAGQIIRISLPLSLIIDEYVHGTFTVAAATNRAGIIYPNDTSSVRFMCEGSTSLLGSNPAYTIANTNVFRVWLFGNYA